MRDSTTIYDETYSLVEKTFNKQFKKYVQNAKNKKRESNVNKELVQKKEKKRK